MGRIRTAATRRERLQRRRGKMAHLPTCTEVVAALEDAGEGAMVDVDVVDRDRRVTREGNKLVTPR